jgi:hypothetical protein
MLAKLRNERHRERASDQDKALPSVVVTGAPQLHPTKPRRTAAGWPRGDDRRTSPLSAGTWTVVAALFLAACAVQLTAP